MAPRPVGSTTTSRQLLLSGCADAVTDEGLFAVLLGREDGPSSVLENISGPGALWNASPEDFTGIPGVGQVGAARLLACIEISRRAPAWKGGPRPVVSSAADVVDLCWPKMRGSDREHFWALALSTRNHLIRIIEVSVGSLNASIVHPRELFKAAVAVSAASVVVVHNHPSGDPTPSGADIQLTRRLVKAGDVLGIELLDHVVIGDDGEHASLRDLGLM